MLSAEGQELFARVGRAPASARVRTHLNDFPIRLIEPATVLEESARWQGLWEELFMRK